MNFDNFVFHDDLEAELSLLLGKPKKIPSPLCFFGYPGNGKTSFARFLANRVTNTVDYFDMNGRKRIGSSSQQVLDQILRCASSLSIMSSSADLWRRAIILDEWHDLTQNEQSAYKVPLEEYSQDNRVLFILCANTDRKNPIDRVLQPAILSRCYSISFNTPTAKLEEAKRKVRAKFPGFSAREIDSAYPDMRKLTRLSELRALTD